MAIEQRRACGFRKVGGLYLTGGGMGFRCDRLPLPIVPCPTCGEEPRFSRGIQRIDPVQLWGSHQCDDPAFDPICFPAKAGDDPAYYLMWVGSEYTPESFAREAAAQGVSKRIPFLPTGFRVGLDWVFLAYQRLIPGASRQAVLPNVGRDDRRGFGPGVFYVFRPRFLEMVLKESETTVARLRELADQGVTPVVVPDADVDHNPKRRKAV